MDSNRVIEIFREITTIPRESGHEEKMTAYLQDFAKKHNLGCKTDSTGNVVITRPASQGKENVPALILQSHQDMVCEKNSDFEHDFSKDPIPYVIEDGWMIAKNTTLGADDGIGVAASLALLESDLSMGKLECLFTISEETGMDGAEALEPGFFTAKTLVNLDSEDEGQLFVGCAGGINTTAEFAYRREELKSGSELLNIKVYNAIGGHSGDDINKGRANAVQLLARFLYAELGNYQLVNIDGGNKRNAIAREAEAVVAVPAADLKAFRKRFEAFGNDIRGEYAVTDPDVSVVSKSAKSDSGAIGAKVTERLISSLAAVHHGILTMSQDIPGLVETSSNLASVKMSGKNRIVVGTSQRSSVESAKSAIADKVAACFRLAGAKVEHSYPYPGWKPNLKSNILRETVESYKRLFGAEPEVKAIHAGLECGLFLKKFPDLDMISFGPTLMGCQAPGEKLDLASNEKFVKLLVDVVTNFR